MDSQIRQAEENRRRQRQKARQRQTRQQREADSARVMWTETDEDKREIETGRHRQTVKIACRAAAI